MAYTSRCTPYCINVSIIIATILTDPNLPVAFGSTKSTWVNTKQCINKYFYYL